MRSRARARGGVILLALIAGFFLGVVACLSVAWFFMRKLAALARQQAEAEKKLAQVVLAEMVKHGQRPAAGSGAVH